VIVEVIVVVVIEAKVIVRAKKEFKIKLIASII
jgi:hypothetical protein